MVLTAKAVCYLLRLVPRQFASGLRLFDQTVDHFLKRDRKLFLLGLAGLNDRSFQDSSRDWLWNLARCFFQRRKTIELSSSGGASPRSSRRHKPSTLSYARRSGFDRLHTEPITEPIILLTLVQQNVQGPDANRQESNAHVSNFDSGCFEPLQIRRILNHLSQQKPRNYTDRKLIPSPQKSPSTCSEH